MLKSDKQHWGSLTKFFHWTIVLLILVQGTLGLVMVDLPKKPSIIPIFSLHKSIGMTILFLAVLRLGWRAFDRRPADPAAMPGWQALGAHAGHMLLYVLLFLVPLSGWWFDSVSGLRPLYWFNLFEIPHMAAPDPALKELARSRHESLFWLLVFVALGHAAMAFVHQFINRDGTLSRMLPAWHRRSAASVAAVTVASSQEVPHVEVRHVDPNPPPAAARPAGAANPDTPAERGPGA